MIRTVLMHVLSLLQACILPQMPILLWVDVGILTNHATENMCVCDSYLTNYYASQTTLHNYAGSSLEFSISGRTREKTPLAET